MCNKLSVQCSVCSHFKWQILPVTDPRRPSVCLSWSSFVGFSSCWTFFLSSLFVNYFCLDLCWRLKLNSHRRRDVTRPSRRVVIRFELTSRNADGLTSAADGLDRKFGNWMWLEFIQLSWVELSRVSGVNARIGCRDLVHISVTSGIKVGREYCELGHDCW